MVRRDGRLDFSAVQPRAASTLSRARTLAAHHLASYVVRGVRDAPYPAGGSGW
ncbi:hypothetical protein [Streptomyces sp. NBC_01237]|uniref:hypothetical protein n=1 Tax=Streptomyces sp. NBC_01237 TaxID=2903790 RepID=UPI002DDC6CCE|nr:hypothetical protein [Streptomyces sp. NBC_01237]WRZ70344.1 hypothetical protein OG251_01215 [Streptomyces sp. NBC_01237]